MQLLDENLLTEEDVETLGRTLQQMGDTVVLTDGQARITYVNDAFLALFECSRDEVLGKCSSVLLAETDEVARHLEQRAAAALSRDGEFCGEHCGRRKDGGRFWVSSRFCRVRVGERRELHRLGIIRDVTERMRTEQALRTSEERFKDITENALEWVWEVDASGKYTYGSPVVEKILGYRPAEILGKHFYDLFHPDDRDELRRLAFEVFAR